MITYQIDEQKHLFSVLTITHSNRFATCAINMHTENSFVCIICCIIQTHHKRLANNYINYILSDAYVKTIVEVSVKYGWNRVYCVGLLSELENIVFSIKKKHKCRIGPWSTSADDLNVLLIFSAVGFFFLKQSEQNV